MTSNNLGSIYATTISSEKYIIIDSQNIELSGNVIISNSSIITNSIIPNITNNESLGTSSKIWSNAYIHDVSINNNIEISGNTIINGVLQVSGNATISGSTLYVPSSFTIDPNGHGDNTGTLLINGNLIVQGETTTINSSVVDISDKMIILASNASNSFEANGAGFEISGAKVKFLYDNTSTSFRSSIGMSISGNVVPVTNSVGSIGESGKIWDIAYIRELNVTNFTNSIDGAKIANETITSTQIMNGSILTADICDNAITFDKLAYNSVGNTRIINLAVTHEKLSSNCVQSHNIVDGTIIDGDISANANILGSKLANNSITSDKINQANNWTFSQLTSTTANIRDVSASNIEVSGNIVPLRDISSNLGSSLKRWNYIYVNDLSVNTINGQAYSAGGGGGGGGGSSIELTSVTSNIIPSTTNTYNLGSTTSYWSNAYINNLKVSNRVYQEISGGINDPSWAAVNGYYALAKDAYPALNPLSSGVNAVMNWSFFQTQGNPICNAQDINSICWSPELRIFVGVASSWQPTRIMTSINGTIWIPRTTPVNLLMIGVCWSSELLIFVAISYNTNIVLTSINGTTWIPSTAHTGNWTGICWSPQLGLFVAVAPDGVNNIMTSTDGINWLLGTIQDTSWLTNDWLARICWSAELGMFAIVNTGNAAVLTSTNGINWTVRTIDNLSVWGGIDICWSKELGIFVAVGVENKGIISNNGINWRVTEIYADNQVTRAVVWSPQLKIFIAFTEPGRRLLISNDGINWTKRIITTESYYYASCWSPELGIFVVGGSTGFIYSSLKGRPPTSYNVFDSSFNSIDETGKWSFQNLGVTGTFTNTSDDRLKHNEIVISNGLAIIDSLTPKFYQKTLTMLDASYNGDLSGQAWTYEAGIIAQELLQISDLSFVVSGGNYYQERYIYSRPTNDPSNVNYDPSLNIYDISNANYTISNTLITQAYNVNYNSIFVYGLAAIKELHQKVKTQETNISTLQTALLEQQATINSLLTRLQALETSAN